RRGQPRGRVLFAGGLPGILPGGKAHGGDLSGPDGLESHEPAQHRPQWRVRRRPGCGGVCRQHLARAPQVIRSEKNAENRKRLSRFRFSRSRSCAGRMIFEKLSDWVRYFTPVRDIPDRKA
ncbi:Replicative DNA helicase, partial [Dysosmobacter welbionis]